MKKNFAEPEMEVVRFNAQDLITTASGGCNDCYCDEGPDHMGEIMPFSF